MAAAVGGYGGGGGILSNGAGAYGVPTRGGAAGIEYVAPPGVLPTEGTYLQLVEWATIESAGNCWQQRMHLIGRFEQRDVCVVIAAWGIWTWEATQQEMKPWLHPRFSLPLTQCGEGRTLSLQCGQLFTLVLQADSCRTKSREMITILQC